METTHAQGANCASQKPGDSASGIAPSEGWKKAYQSAFPSIKGLGICNVLV